MCHILGERRHIAVLSRRNWFFFFERDGDVIFIVRGHSWYFPKERGRKDRDVKF